MIKILLVDDEPFIRKGIQILIDWENYGYEIVAEASNGVEAIKELEKNEIDLIITDIKMPEMNGLEFIEYTQRNINKKYKFIVLSGFYEFEYAKKAIEYNVKDYILKPIVVDELIKVLANVKEEYLKEKIKDNKERIKDKAIYDKNLKSIIFGKYDEAELDYVKKYLDFNGSLRYIIVEINHDSGNYISDDCKRKAQRELYKSMMDILCEYSYRVIFDVSNDRNCYDVGFIYNKELAKEKGITEKEYILMIQEELIHRTKHDFYMYIGQKVEYIEDLSLSYKSANIAKVFTDFPNITYYDDIVEINEVCYGVEKKYIDELIKKIEENNEEEISQCVDMLYDSFKKTAIDLDVIKMNVNYLLCNLINIAKKLDAEADQQEVMKYITYGAFEKIISRGSAEHLKEFSFEFAKYLAQLRENSASGVLNYIEKEISERYMEKLSLKYLSEKYYINSAYLGQVFKKKYNISFNDYLNNFRIEKASQLLALSDKKIYEISDIVGYSNTDYFINKFVQSKGRTPSQYRKQLMNNNKRTIGLEDINNIYN